MKEEQVVIFNDFSLSGQFSTKEAFLDSFREKSLPVWNVLAKNKVVISCGQQLYNLQVTESHKVNDVLHSRGNPEVTKLKMLIQKGPFWDDVSDSKNCLHEAFKQQTAIFSFEHDEYKQANLAVNIGGETVELSNIFTNITALDFLNAYSLITATEKIELAYLSIKFSGNYFEEMCVEAKFSENDINSIVKDLNRFVRLLTTGQELGRYSKTIERDLKEFRATANGKEVRIFYFFKDGVYIFMNGFMKKTPKTPRTEIDKAKRIQASI